MQVAIRTSWSPDGEMLAFSSNREGNFEVYIIVVDGERALRMTDNLMDDFEPVWSSETAASSLLAAYTPENLSSEYLTDFTPSPLKISSVAKSLAETGMLTRTRGKIKNGRKSIGIHITEQEILQPILSFVLIPPGSQPAIK
jgi:hypothetical protein